MYKLICTSYDVINFFENSNPEQSLVLRDNWIEENYDDTMLIEFCERFKIDTDFKYPSKGTVSPILVGKMELDGVQLHVRIIKF